MTEGHPLEAQVMAALSTVIEPELHQDLVTLNMIRNLTFDGDTARFTIMLTTPACPLKDQIHREATAAVTAVNGISQAEIAFDANVTANPQISSQLNLQVKNVIAISSGKGGVGKSTVAANLAIALSQSGTTVGLMDADITGPNLPLMMGVEGRLPVKDGKMMPAEAHGVKLISMGFLVDPDRAMIWRGPMLHSAIRQFFTDVQWGAIDYMVVDLPPGTSDAQLSLAQFVPLTGAVIVTQPQEVALGDAERGLQMFNQLKVPIIGVVENMSGDFFGEGGGKKLAEKHNVPFLGTIPLDPNVRVGGDTGQPIVIAHPESAAAQALVAFSQEVAARVSVLNHTLSDNIIPLTTIG